MTTEEKIEKMKQIVREVGPNVRGTHPSWILHCFKDITNLPEGFPPYISLTVKEYGNIWSPFMFVRQSPWDKNKLIYSNNTNVSITLYKDSMECWSNSSNAIEFDYKEITRDDYINHYYDSALSYEEHYGVSMSEFKKYRRTNIAEMREVTKEDIYEGVTGLIKNDVSISPADINNGSPKYGDMIARNPMNHNDQWLVASDYFKENFELI